MAETYDSFEYKDISELKKELEAIKGRKDVSNKELYEAVQKLAQAMNNIVEVFGAAAEQMKLEDKERDSEAKKHEMILSKLDRMTEQNKTLAEGMVAIVDMAKKNFAPAKEKEEKDEASMLKQSNEEQFFKPKEVKPFAEPNLFMKPSPQQDWQPKPEMMPKVQQAFPSMQPIMPSMPQSITPHDFGMQMPPMEPAPSPNLDFDFGEELPSLEEPKKKGLFGMFKKS